MQRFLQVVFLLMLFTSLLSARSITVTTPNGGEILQAGRSTQLQWISSGVTFVKIQFTTNDGSSWSDVIYKTDASLGSYQWDIPNNPTSQAKIRVIDFDSTAYADTSNATFQIVQLSLTSPILNQKIQTGKSTSIQWSASSNVATVKLEYSTNGGGTWTTITSFLSALPASYNWTPIPNTPSTTALVRISMPSVPAVSDTSANFSITSLALTKPVGGETWFAGSVKAITWTSANIANVKLEYSTDNGFSWGTITSIVSATSGTYSWTLPASFSTNQALVRISDASASSIADQSGSVFTISSLTVLSPNGGEGFAPSSTQTITWSAPYFNMVNVQYSTDNGVSWNTIQNSVNASLGSLSWNLPAISFANGKIRIVATDDSTNYDVSNNSFKVASIAVTAPNGSENLQKGFVKRITWTNSSPVTSVNIDLSTDNGGSWLPIISGASASTGYYDWTVGDYPSSQALIRISDAANPNISDQSDAVFTIKKLDLTSPNGGEYFQAGTVRQITWTSGNIANVKIEYSTDSGSTWSTAISSVSAAAGTYDWTVPSTPTNLAKVRISDAAASSIAATSSSVFNISLLTLVSPNGGENFSVSSGQNIQWTSSSIANVKLEYTTNNGVTWKTIISSTPAALSSYAWTVPNDPTVSAKVRISDVLNSATTDASSAVFTISTLKVTSPNGGEKWAVGSSQTITWQNISSVSNVDISYSIDNGTNWIPIPSATNIAAGLETYTWSIPDTTTSSSLAKIKVSNTPDNTINDVSDLVFTLAKIRVTSPNGGDTLQVGKQYNITWSSSNVSLVNINYSTDNGLNWTTFAPSISASAGTYAWTVPNIPTSQALIKIEDVLSPAVADQSDAAFKIFKLDVVSPNGGEKWAVGNTKTITWNNVSSLASVNIDYSTNNGSTWIPVTTNIAAALQTYDWNIPDTLTPSSSARIKISSFTSPLIYDVSDNVFTFAKIKVTSPNSGDTVQVGKQYNIAWDASNISSVNIKVSTDNGVNWSQITTVAASVGNYLWTVNSNPTQQAFIRIEDVSDTTVFDQSNVAFKIVSLDLTSPNGSESWTIGSTKNITWTSSGIANVKLEYSTNNGVNWTSINSSVVAASGSYAWTIPGSASSQALVRISDAVQPLIKDSSLSTFYIGTLSVTGPGAGTIHQAGKAITVNWTSSGIDNVNIAYTTNNGTSWTILPDVVSSAAVNSFTFTLPANLSSTQARIRVSDASTGQIRDSSGIFTIASLTVTYPNGGNYLQAGKTDSIKWSSSSVTTVRIDYSSDNGSNWNNLVLSYPAVSGIYSWALDANYDSPNFLIKVSDTADPTIVDSSDNTFKIGNITNIDSPLAGDTVLAGSIKPITWVNTSSVTQVKIEYSTDDGFNYNIIESSYPSTITGGTYNWTVPAALTSTTGRIRISDANSNLGIKSISGQFSFLSLTVTSPNGNEIWQTGSTNNITWTASPSIANVKIEYSKDGGQSYTSIIASVSAGLGTYAWTISDTLIVANQMCIRISDVTNSNIKDTSNALFTVAKLKLLTPVASDYLQGGKTKLITWESAYIQNVRIQYSSNGGGSYNDIIASTPAAAGSYSWTIPNTATSSAKIRISSVNTPTIVDSSSLFKVISLQVLTPNGLENLQSGSTTNITWSPDVNIDSVVINYSINNGISWNSIISLANTGSFVWTVPDSITTSGRIKISDKADATINDISDNAFTISSYAISSPQAGYYWQSGTTHAINWNIQNVATVNIYYSVDGGVNWLSVQTNVPTSNGTYNWTVPAIAATNQAMIKISDVLNPTNAITSGQFKISNLAVTTPNGGENYIKGSTKNITWTSGANIDTVVIKYSVNNGISWNNITTVANTGSYAWLVPDSLTTTGKIRISDTKDSINDVSDAAFSISSYAISSPQAGYYWQSGTTHAINWNIQNVATVNIYYSVDGGVNWLSVQTNVPASNGTYNWTVPAIAATNQAMIKISDVLNPTNAITSGQFKISNLAVTTPNGGENYIKGSTKNITWTSGSNIDTVVIKYSVNNGISWNNITTVANTGSYAWLVPDSLTTTGKIRISDTKDSINDVSDAAFSISSYAINSPLAGYYWQSGTTHAINWNIQNVATVNIYYSVDGGVNWLPVQTNVPASNGTYNWTVPAITATSQAMIKISDALPTSNSVTSAQFKISNLAVTSPNGGENLQAKSTKNITWTAGSDITNVKIEYNDGIAWTPLTNSTPNTGSYTWTVPDTITTLGRIRISDQAGSGITATSNTTFTISSYAITNPTTAAYWQGGTTQPINWNIQNVANVKIEYFDGTNWNTVIASVPASNGTYNWTLPTNIATSSALIKISDVLTPANLIVSSPFKISNLTVTAPNGGENLQAGSIKNITWTAGSNIDSVVIKYSLDNGTSWNSLTTRANTGTYLWTVPDTVTTLGRIRISDKADSMKDVSDNSFTISRYAITNPTTASYWQGGTTQSITWNIGNVANVKIEYSTDNGATWGSVIGSIAASSGIYNWAVPGNIATNLALIRISDVLPTSNSVTSGQFKIGNLTVNYPNGGVNLQTGSTKNITWSAGSNIDSVVIQYTINNGASWSNLNKVKANTGTYSWIIPNIGTDSAKIRISDATDSTFKDESDNRFSIQSLTLTSPIAGERVQAGKLYPNFITWNASSNIAFAKVELSTDGGSNWTTLSANVNASAVSYPVTFSSSISTAQAKIRISNSADATILSQSGNFTITQLALTSPVGTEYWQAGTNKNITWTSGQITNLALAYSSDNGGTWNNIIASTPASAGTYSWAIPSGLASSQVKIRITDAIDTSISATHQNPFVVGNVSVVAPNGGEIFLVGSVDTIRWTASTNVSSVRIDFSSNNGSTWNLITNNTPANAGQYLWAISNQSVTPSSAFLIRVSDAASNLAIRDSSNSVFSVNGLRVVSPNGGEQYQVGSIKRITWSVSGIANVRLEYSTDGTVWNPIANSLTASTGFYDWTIPDASSSTVRVKISDELNPTYSDISDADFKIANVTLTSPNGGERWQIGYKKNITWSNSSNVSKVNLYYKTSPTASWVPIDTNVVASANSYSWLIPNAATQQAVVRITDAASNFAIQDTGNASFTISNIELTSPLGGENWRSGKANIITWNRSSDVTNVDLYYSIDNGTSWSSILLNTPASALQYSWNIPANLNVTNQVKVRIHNSADISISDTSGTFSIYYPSLTLIAPNGGDYIQAGSPYQITWSSALVSKVKIDYYNGTTWSQLTNTQPADSQKYIWTPDTSLSSINGKIRVFDADDNTIGDTSNLAFKVGYVQLTSLNGGENLQVNSTKNITWKNSASVTAINLELSTNNGTSWTTIQAALPASPATFAWSVPNTPSDSMRIRISDASSGNLISYKSSTPFSISSLNLTSPDGGETYQTGKQAVITWNASSNTQNVKLEYSTINGTLWNYIADTTASLSSYSWTIPNNIANATTNALIRISNSLFPNIKDSSQAVFAIKYLELSAPVAGDQWQVNTTQTIKWNSVNVTTVKLEYSIDTTWVPIALSVSAALKSYDWVVPFNTSSNVRIKISDTANAAISFISAPFKIANITLSSPNGGQNWQVGSKKNITWIPSNVSYVNLYYKVSPTGNWLPIATSITASDNSYQWTVPNTVTQQAIVKITDASSNTSVQDTSDAYFTISNVELTSPLGGENWRSGKVNAITWNRSSDVANVDLYYSINNGISWDAITTNILANTGSYSWNIPANINSSQLKVRIFNSTDASIADTSGTFSVFYPLLSLVKPDGGEYIQAASPYQITWSSFSVTKVKIDYSSNNGVTWQQLTNTQAADSQKFTWVPDTSLSSLDGKIRIFDADDITIGDSSSSTFKVGYVQLTALNGGENLQVNSTKNITWKNSTSVTDIKLEFSSNNGTSWNTIQSLLAASPASYTWSVPNIPSDSMRIRISDASSLNSISAISTSPFSISSVDLLLPNGGETYQTGKKVAISWNASTNTQDVKLEFYDGTQWNAIADTIASLGSYSWTTPNAIGNGTSNGRIRISNLLYPSIKDSSQSVFTTKYLALSAPVALDEWQVNSTKGIVWNSSANVQAVNIDYSTNNGVSWIPISSNVLASQKTYNWLIPNTPTATARIKITDSANTIISVTSDSFKIYNPTLTLTSPVGNEQWQAGFTKDITWTSTLVDLLNIDYSLDEGTTWKSLKTNVTASTGMYSWKIPDTLSTNKARIKISAILSGPAVTDSSASDFTVTRIKVVSPNGNEILQAGTTDTIKWDVSSHVAAVNLEYSSDGGATWSNSIATNVTAALKQYAWVIPNGYQTNQGRVRVIAANALTINDTSDVNFKIGWIAVSSPNGNENLQAGRTYPITWTKSNNVSNVRIEYSLTGDTNYQLISANDSTGKYYWTIPTNISSDLGRIKISDATAPDKISDISDTTFKVSILKITSPVEGTNWIAGSTQTIKWNSSANISTVRIEYSPDNGLTWATTVTPSTNASDSSFSWNIPNNLISTQAKIRILSTTNTSISDTSGKFTIFVPSVTLTYPNGSERLSAGSTDTITWNAQYVTSIKIEYSSNNGVSWDSLDIVNASIGKYVWTIKPGESTSQALIKISDIASSNIKDSSNAVFTVGWINVTSPNGNQNWLAGSKKDITWDVSASVTQVKIEYYYDQSTAPLLIAAGVQASDKKYTWTVPSIAALSGKIRITDFAPKTAITDSSQGNLGISVLTLVSPNGGEFLNAGKTTKIKWIKNPASSNLKLEYLIDDGNGWQTIANSVPDSVKEYDWLISGNITSDSAYVRITDVADTNIRSISNNKFKIGRLQVLLPSSSIKILETTVYNIQWSASTNIPLIDLYYSTNNGKSWIPIANAQGISSTTGSFNWSVPETPSDSCLIRIRNTSDINVYSSSDSLFTIAELKLLSPNGGQVWQTGTEHQITWQSKYVTNLQIQYKKDNEIEWTNVTPNTIASSLDTYTWKITDDINLADTNFRVRIRDIEYLNIADTSNTIFTLSYLKLIAPNGGVGQQIGTTSLIEWSHSAKTIQKVKLEYTTDDKSWTYIDTVSADSGHYLWKIQNTPTQSSRVRVSDFSQPTISDASDSLFVISYIALKYPNGGKSQKVQVGKTYTISWEGKYLNGASIDYSINNGANWTRIENASNLSPDSTHFNWTIENYPSTQCLVRVSDSKYPTIYDISDTLFTICSLTLTSPNELVALQNNTTQTITWESQNIDSVRIQLSLDNGLTWPTSIVSAQSAAQQRYDWLVGNQKSAYARLRISDQFDFAINDVNDTNFVIGSYPKITQLSPNQADTIKLAYDFGTPGEQLEMTKFEYSINFNSPVDALSSVTFKKNNTLGPVVDTLKWASKDNLPNFEGYAKVIITLKSNFNVSYVVELDSVGVDNVPPRFDVTSFTATQNPFTLGWSKARLNWNPAIDINGPVKYAVTWSTDDLAKPDSSSKTSKDTTMDVSSLSTSTKYKIKFTVTDALSNAQVFNTEFKTMAAVDFNGDNQIDIIDLASFVKSWSATSPDSMASADLAPYTDSIPFVKVRGDDSRNIQDLFVFVDMWNYYQTSRSLPKKSFSLHNGNDQVETRDLKIRKGKNSFVYAINLDDGSDFMALSAEVHYNPARMRFDSTSILGLNKKLESGFTLLHNDSLNGVLTINYADLSGKLDKQLQFIASLTSNMDRMSKDDSLVIVIKAIDKSMKRTYSKQVVYSIKEVPNSFNLSQNYPNPFNPRTMINYELPAKARVSLLLFDILGRKVATLIDEEQDEGYYQFGLDANKVGYGLASGVYIYRLSAGNFNATKKMILLK